jgi:2'-hydroxyisoflavone reductase
MRLDRRTFLTSSSAVPLSTLASGLAAAAKDPKLRILILGGTGFIGPNQVRYALSRGHEVTIFNRGRQPVDWPGRVEELIGDRNTGDLKALEGRSFDVCIDNPTTLPFWVRDAGQALAGRVGQYIFISTMSVYAKNDAAADETAPVQTFTGGDPMAVRASSNDLYGALKATSEGEARRQFGDRLTIIRPGLIVGPGDETDRFTYWPVRLARGGDVLAPGDGTDPAQVIDARDLAEWIIRVAERRSLGVFNATGPAAPLSFTAFLGEVGAGVGAAYRPVWVPASFLAAQKVAPWSDMPVWIPATGEFAGFAKRDISRALKDGLTFRPLAATAADTLAWSRTRPPERQAKLHAGLAPEREAAVLEAWRARS